MKQLCAFAFSLFFLFSCGSPPENATYMNILELTDFLAKKTLILKGDHEALKIFQEEGKNQNIVIEIDKDSKITFQTKYYPIPNKNENIGYSLDNHTYKLLKDLYLTKGKRKNEFLFSFDHQTWYSTARKNKNSEWIENIFVDYFFDVQYEKTNNFLSLLLYGSAKLGRNPFPVDPPLKSQTILTKQDQILYHAKGKGDLQLHKNILKIPKGTTLKTMATITGNLINTKNENGLLQILFLKDLFLYYKKNSVSISFNKTDWDISIFNFQLKNDLKVMVTGEKEITIFGFMEIIYKK